MSKLREAAEKVEMRPGDKLGAITVGLHDDPGIVLLRRIVDSISIVNKMACWDHFAMFELRDYLCERAELAKPDARPAPAEPQPIAAWSIVRTAESAVVTAVRAALSAAPAPQPAGGERERYEFVLAQCREAQDIAASRGWALNDIATASTTDPRARKIATEALLSALSQPAAQQERKPLTEEKINDFVRRATGIAGGRSLIGEQVTAFTRIVESAHGITATKGDSHE